MKRIRISLNLIHYFQDHRQLAKIFVKNDMQLIEDLHNHIVKIFNIDRNFYLMCQNHFLPPIEDIHILNDNDVIYVIPNQKTEETTIVKKKKKKDLANGETNTIVTLEDMSKKKKKKKKCNSIENVLSFASVETQKNKKDATCMETNNVETEVLKKKKKRQTPAQILENIYKDCNEHINISKNKTTQLVTNEEFMETSNIVETEINLEMPKKKKRKTQTEDKEINKSKATIDIGNVENNSLIEKSASINFQECKNLSETSKRCNNEDTSKNNVNETIIFRESNKFDSIFTNQNDITIELENNTEYNFVNESRRKRRRCISPPAVLLEEESLMETNLENSATNANSMKIIQTVEHLSPNTQNEMLQKIQYSPRQSYSLTDMLHFNTHCTSSPATNEIKTIIEKGTKSSPLKPSRKQLSGVGKVLEFLKTEQESDDVSEINEQTYPIPKRKRIRTRKRKQKNIESPTESNEHSDHSVFIPPKTIAAPKIHIKFEDATDANANSVKTNENENLSKPTLDNFGSQNGFVHSTPLNKTIESARKSESNRISINSLDPSALPLMSDTPAVKSIILFQKLKLGADYNPTISNYILAEIEDVTKNGNELHLKILEGHEELEEPFGGRFSCMIEDEENIDYDEVQIFERITLIDSRLVK